MIHKKAEFWSNEQRLDRINLSWSIFLGILQPSVCIYRPPVSYADYWESYNRLCIYVHYFCIYKYYVILLIQLSPRILSKSLWSYCHNTCKQNTISQWPFWHHWRTLRGSGWHTFAVNTVMNMLRQWQAHFPSKHWRTCNIIRRHFSQYQSDFEICEIYVKTLADTLCQQTVRKWLWRI